MKYKFSSLSESGFIPTAYKVIRGGLRQIRVLISFREWLHSYYFYESNGRRDKDTRVLISFREWLHSY